MSGRSDLLDLTLHIHHKTAQAVLVSEDGDKDRAVWLPLGQIEIEVTKTSAVVTAPYWLAKDKGLI